VLKCPKDTSAPVPKCSQDTLAPVPKCPGSEVSVHPARRCGLGLHSYADDTSVSTPQLWSVRFSN